MNTLRITLPLLFAGLVVAAGSAASDGSSRPHIAAEPALVNDAPCEQAVRGYGPGRPLPIPMAVAATSSSRAAVALATPPPAAPPAPMPIAEADALTSASPTVAAPVMSKIQRSPVPMGGIMGPMLPAQYATGRDNYKHRDANAVHLAASDPVSTFSIDVDTGSYTNVRHMLNEGRRPMPCERKSSSTTSITATRRRRIARAPSV